MLRYSGILAISSRRLRFAPVSLQWLCPNAQVSFDVKGKCWRASCNLNASQNCIRTRLGRRDFMWDIAANYREQHVIALHHGHKIREKHVVRFADCPKVLENAQHFDDICIACQWVVFGETSGLNLGFQDLQVQNVVDATNFLNCKVFSLGCHVFIGAKRATISRR